MVAVSNAKRYRSRDTGQGRDAAISAAPCISPRPLMRPPSLARRSMPGISAAARVPERSARVTALARRRAAIVRNGCARALGPRSRCARWPAMPRRPCRR